MRRGCRPQSLPVIVTIQLPVHSSHSYITSSSCPQRFVPLMSRILSTDRFLIPQDQRNLWYTQPSLPCGSKQLQQARLKARSCGHTSRPLISLAFCGLLYQMELVSRSHNLPASCTWCIKAACGVDAAVLQCRCGRGSASWAFPLRSLEEPVSWAAALNSHLTAASHIWSLRWRKMKAGRRVLGLVRHAGNAPSLWGRLRTWPSPNLDYYSLWLEEIFLERVHCTLPGMHLMYAGVFAHKQNVANRCLH